MNRGRWGVGVERRRPESGVATSRGLREATATAGTPGSGSRVRAQISQCLSSQNSQEVWRFVKRVKFVLSSSCCSERDIITWGTRVCSKIPTCGSECQKSLETTILVGYKEFKQISLSHALVPSTGDARLKYVAGKNCFAMPTDGMWQKCDLVKVILGASPICYKANGSKAEK